MTSHSQITGWANPPRPTELAHRLLEDVLKAGDHVIDATCGNGHDTLFLARCVGSTGHVLAFDVQETAIHSARQLLQSKGVDAQVSFHCESHVRLAEHAASASIAAVMFNLGYLPGADHMIITRSSETLPALESATHVLRPGGWLCVVCYPGHEGGDDEASAVEQWMAALAPGGWRIARYGMLGTRKPAPFLLAAVKPG